MAIASIILVANLVAILSIVVLSVDTTTNATAQNITNATAQNTTNATAQNTTNATAQNTTNATAQNTTNTTLASTEKVQVSIVPGASFLTDDSYSPNPVEVTVGQTVLWTNDDTAFHTVTSGIIGAADSGTIFDSGLAGPTALISKGKTFEHTFDTAGEFPYFCTLHPAMVGTVIVK
jgi:plastocyanin